MIRASVLAVTLVACSSSDFTVGAATDAASAAEVAEDTAAPDALDDDTTGPDVLPPPPDAPPPSPYAIELDGSGFGTVSSAATSLAPASGFTWELWFRPTAPPAATMNGRTQVLVALADPADCEDIYLGFGSDSTPADSWDPLESTCRHASLSIL